MTRLQADLALLFAALIWGTAFIAQKQGNDSIGPLTFVGLRFLLSWIALAPLAAYEHVSAGRRPLGKASMRLAGAIGLCLFAGTTLQQFGLLTTTATNAGFLSTLYVVLVPAILWAITGSRPRRVILIAAILSLAGSWFLTAHGAFGEWRRGDSFIVAADVAWAAGICLVPIFLARAQRPFFLAFAQYGVAAVLGLLAGIALEPQSAAGVASALPSLLYAGLCSGGVAYTLQIVAQRYTPPAEAALIMSLESVFAALSGAILLGERLTGLAVLGCALILTGVVLAEAGPMMRKPRPSRKTAPAHLETA
ncbi:DMT family transporter [Methylocystis echinoides]|uniref:MFS transporter n=1 Tax=Methylocystis echinoides TaxID=29468 RepID=A0A9W6GVU0_9HYPH|nr:DMT family transporter [Methylocystis echinoides]GLI93805.1 MFS transporter [Methylocystis echinoides]